MSAIIYFIAVICTVVNSRTQFFEDTFKTNNWTLISNASTPGMWDSLSEMCHHTPYTNESCWIIRGDAYIERKISTIGYKNIQLHISMNYFLLSVSPHNNDNDCLFNFNNRYIC